MSKPINLVLSGGGARGIAHIGIIEVLEQKGFEIATIAGTSMGALVGGVYAGDGMAEFKTWLFNADIKQAVRMLDFSFKLPGLIKGEKIMHRIEQMLTIKQIENLKIPYTAVATDLNQNSEVDFTDGNLIEAIRASIAIPSIFTPVYKDRQILLDGGLVNNIPLNRLPDNGLPVVAVCANADIPVTNDLQQIMHTNQKDETDYNQKLSKIRQHINKMLRHKKPNDKTLGYTEILDRSLHLLIAQVSNQIIARHQPDLLINIPRKLAGTLDFLKAEKIYNAGLYLGEKAFENSDNLLR